MTLRRHRWLLLPLLAALALAALVLPPRALPERATLFSALLGFGGSSWRRDAQEEHRWSIEAARDRLRAAIAARTHGAADALAARSGGALRSAAEPVVVVRDRDVPEASARAWLRAAEAQLATVPRAAGSGVEVIVALHSRDPRPDARDFESSGVSLYRFEFEGRAGRACIVDVLLPPRAQTGRDRFGVPGWAKGSLLGRCALYARYGFPGSEVGRWVGLGPRWTRGSSWWGGDDAVFGVPRLLSDTLYWRPRYGGDVPWAELSCFRGMDAYCLALSGLASPWALGRGPIVYYYGWGYGPMSDRLVADVIQHRPPERFATFWSSSLAPESALGLAYGVPAGRLAREAFARRYLPEPLAQPSAGDLLVAAGWVIALGLLAVALAWRREMDL